MHYLEILNWPHAGGLTLGDQPIFTTDGVHVYELISNYEQIEVKNSSRYLGTYKHVALKDESAHVFDISSKRLVINLGPFRLYKVGHDWSLHPIA